MNKIITLEKNPIVLLGGGFISNHIRNKLLLCNYDVTVIDKIKCDFLNPQQIKKAFANVKKDSCFIILASANRFKSNQSVILSNNKMIINNILRYIPDQSNRLIYFSSIDVYGSKPALPITEQTVLAPNDAYSESKVYSEEQIIKKCSARDIPYTIFRLPGVYGAGDSSRALIHKMCVDAITKNTIRLNATENLLRDCISVEDLTEIICLSISGHNNGIYNLVTGECLSIRQIAELISEVLERDIKIVCINDGSKIRVFDLFFDTKKINNAFNFKFRSLKDGINKYLISKSYSVTNEYS